MAALVALSEKIVVPFNRRCLEPDHVILKMSHVGSCPQSSVLREPD